MRTSGSFMRAMLSDHGTHSSVETIEMSKFKAIRRAVLDRMGRMRKPVARTPLAPAPTGEWLGAMQDDGEIRDDLVAPAADPSEWDVIRQNGATARYSGRKFRSATSRQTDTTTTSFHRCLWTTPPAKMSGFGFRA